MTDVEVLVRLVIFYLLFLGLAWWFRMEIWVKGTVVSLLLRELSFNFIF